MSWSFHFSATGCYSHIGTRLDSFATYCCGGIGLVSFWAVVLQTCGKFHSQSVKIRESWRIEGEDKYFRKWRKSVTPLYFGHPGYHVIKRLSILKFGKTIIRGTFRTMVTLNNVWLIWRVEFNDLFKRWIFIPKLCWPAPIDICYYVDNWFLCITYQMHTLNQLTKLKVIKLNK